MLFLGSFLHQYWCGGGVKLVSLMQMNLSSGSAEKEREDVPPQNWLKRASLLDFRQDMTMTSLKALLSKSASGS